MKKYMRNKVLPMLMTLVMVIGLLPVMGGTAKAATASKVYVGAVALTNNTYTTTGMDGPITGNPAGSVESYAYFNSGTLTLHNFTYEGTTYLHSKYYPTLIYTAGDLTIKLEGTNTLTATEVYSTSSTNCGIYAEGETATLTIQGDGLNDKLIVDLGDTTSAASNGIYVVANLSVNKCFIDITGGNGTGTSYGQFCCGIRVNGSNYSVRITDSIVNCTGGSSIYSSCGLTADQPSEIIITNSVVNATGAIVGFSAGTCHKFELRNSTLNGTANGSTAATGINISTYRGSPLGTIELYSGTFKGSSQNYNPGVDYKGGIFIIGEVNGYNPSGAQWQTWGDASGTFKVIYPDGAYWEYTLGKTSAFICEPLYAVSQSATGDGSGTVVLTVDGKALDGGKTTARSWVDVVITPAMGSGVKNVSVSNGAYIEQVEESQNRYRFFMPNSNVTVTVEYELLAPLFDPQSGNPLILGGGDIEAGYTAPTDYPSNSDYTFEGWFTQPNGGGEKMTSGYQAGVTYYAHWTKNGKSVFANGLDLSNAENVDEPINGYTWVKDTKTLTLYDLCVDSVNSYGLKLPDGAIVVLADGTENVISGGNADGDTYGIYSAGAYTLDGTGKLTVTAGDSTGGNSCALPGTVTMKSGIVTATGGKVASGTSCGADTLILKDGTITLNGGDTTGDNAISCGVNDLTTDGGFVFANGGNATGNSATSQGVGTLQLEGGEVTATGGNATGNSSTSCGVDEVTVVTDGRLTAAAGEATNQKGIGTVDPGEANPGIYFSPSNDERELSNFEYGSSTSIEKPNKLAMITFAPALNLSDSDENSYVFVPGVEGNQNKPSFTVNPARWPSDNNGVPIEIGTVTYQLCKVEGDSETPVSNKYGEVSFDNGVGSITDLDLSGLIPGDYVLKVTTPDPTNADMELVGTMKITIVDKEISVATESFVFDFETVGATATAPVFNGEAHTPDVVIMDGYYQLVKGTDYDLVYSDGINETDAISAGNYTVTISFKGNYSGDDIVKNFTVAPLTLTKENITSTLVPVMDGENLSVVGDIKWGNHVLVKGEDYEINVEPIQGDATKANISITFKDGSNYQNAQVEGAPVPLVYEGQTIRTQVKDAMFSFTIGDEEGEGAFDFTVDSIPYTGSEIELVINAGEMVEGVHYTVAYENNVGAGEGKIVITGIPENGFAGTIEKTFTIAKAEQAAPDVSKLTIMGETVASKGDGSISGVTDQMEYRKVDGAWKDITGTKLTGLEPGEYEIRYKADKNHLEGAVSEKITISDSAVTLTVKFDLQGGSGEAAEQSGFAYGAKGTSEPSDPTRENHTFLGWTLKDGTAWVFGADGSAVTDNITLYAKWVRTGYTVSGIVKDGAGNPVSGATVTAKQGNLTYESKPTNGAGAYTFANVPAGTYNLVVEYGKGDSNPANDKTVTVLVVVNADARMNEIKLPTDQVSSKVDIVPGTPNIMVGNLDKQANAAMGDLRETHGNGAEIAVTVDMKVEAKVSEEVEENAKNQIVGEAAVQSNNLSFVDIDITQTTIINGNSSTAAVTETKELLKIIVPFVTAGRRDFTVYRYHVVNDVGTVHELTTTPDETTGEYIEVGNGEIIVYAKKFSTYAIGYTVGSNNNNSSNNKPNNSGPSGGIYVPPVKPAEPVSYDKCKHDGACPLNEFTDLRPDAWYHDAVHYCIDNGIMNGYGKDFRAEGAVTRQQVWMMLARLSGETPANMAAARTWAMANGVSDGTTPTNAVTRQQFITMLYRYAVDKGYDVSVGEDTNILSYADAFSVSEYAIPAMQWGCAEGIMGGYADGSLKPVNGATRAHVAAFLQRFCEGPQAI